MIMPTGIACRKGRLVVAKKDISQGLTISDGWML